MNKMINTLMPGENKVEFNAIVTNVINGKTNKSPYLSLVLEDSTGSIDAKLWAVTKEQMDTILKGKVVHVVGDVIKYNTDVQVKINSIEVTDSSEQEQIKYLKSAPEAIEKMQNEIQSYFDKINNNNIKNIVEYIYKLYEDVFSTMPAASKNHHEYVSGLIYHTLSMLRIAEHLCVLYPSLNMDLLYAGILLHDIGKTEELSGPIVPEYTTKGKLLGHISIGQNIIEKAATDLEIDGEEVVLLKHLVLSHHGKMEYGSPVLPIIMEAEILSLIDNIDARMNMMEKALSMIEPGEFSKRIFSLENRSFYKPKLF